MGFLFGGSGGGTTTTSVNYPPYIEQAGEETLDLARALGTKPYTPYQQPRVAPLAAGEQQAIQGAQAASGAYRPTFQQARDLTTSSAGAFGGTYQPTAVTAPNVTATSVDPREVNTSAFSSEAAQRYMNPYIDVALDPTLRRLGEDTTRRIQSDRANAASIGAFGGARQGFLEAQREEDLLEARGDVLGQGYAQAFDRALGAFQTDEQRMLQAQMANQGAFLQGDLANQQARLQAALANQGMARDLGMFNETQRMGSTALAADIFGANRERERAAGQGLGLLAGQESTLINEDTNRLMATGGLERQVGQRSLDTLYSDFLEERDWDDRALDYMIRGLAGIPLPENQRTQQPNPNYAAQAAGLGLAAYGAFS